MIALPWYAYACLVVAGATGIHFFSKLAKGLVDPFVALIYTMFAGLLLALCFYPFASETISKSHIFNKGLFLYASVGICITVAHLGIYLMFNAGAPMSLATPLVRFAPAVFAIVLGLLFFHETIKLHQWFGVAMAFISFYLITKV